MLGQWMLEYHGKNSVYNMRTKNTNLTKQGVRDLDNIPSKSKWKKLPMPPKNQLCKHEHIRTNHLTGDTECLDCGTLWDWNGKEW